MNCFLLKTFLIDEMCASLLLITENIIFVMAIIILIYIINFYEFPVIFHVQ